MEPDNHFRLRLLRANYRRFTKIKQKSIKTNQIIWKTNLFWRLTVENLVDSILLMNLCTLEWLLKIGYLFQIWNVIFRICFSGFMCVVLLNSEPEINIRCRPDINIHFRPDINIRSEGIFGKKIGHVWCVLRKVWCL